MMGLYWSCLLLRASPAFLPRAKDRVSLIGFTFLAVEGAANTTTTTNSHLPPTHQQKNLSCVAAQYISRIPPINIPATKSHIK